MPQSRLAAIYKLGEAYRLWGARSEGVKASKQRRAPPAVESDSEST